MTFVRWTSVCFMERECGQHWTACTLQPQQAGTPEVSEAQSQPGTSQDRIGHLKSWECLPGYPCFQGCTLGIPGSGFPGHVCCTAMPQLRTAGNAWAARWNDSEIPDHISAQLIPHQGQRLIITSVLRNDTSLLGISCCNFIFIERSLIFFLTEGWLL